MPRMQAIYGMRGFRHDWEGPAQRFLAHEDARREKRKKRKPTRKTEPAKDTDGITFRPDGVSGTKMVVPPAS